MKHAYDNKKGKLNHGSGLARFLLSKISLGFYTLQFNKTGFHNISVLYFFDPEGSKDSLCELLEKWTTPNCSS